MGVVGVEAFGSELAVVMVVVVVEWRPLEHARS
jgi:hypothetical protein